MDYPRFRGFSQRAKECSTGEPRTRSDRGAGDVTALAVFNDRQNTPRDVGVSFGAGLAEVRVRFVDRVTLRGVEGARISGLGMLSALFQKEAPFMDASG